MKIQLKRSSVLSEGAAKKPEASQLEYGELAVNYASADPTIFLKDSTNSVIAIAGANALTQVPTLDEVTTAGNFSSDGMLLGGSQGTPNLQLNPTGNVVTVGHYTANKGTNTDTSFAASLSGTETYKVLGSGTVALGGTLDSTTDQSQAKIVLNADTGVARSTSLETSGTINSGGEITGSAGATFTGTVSLNNSLNVTEGTSLTGAVTMGNNVSIAGTLGVTGASTLAAASVTTLTAATVVATTYNLGALAALPE